MQGDQHEHRSPQQRAEHGVGDDEPFAVVPVHDRAAEHVADMRGNLAERGEPSGEHHRLGEREGDQRDREASHRGSDRRGGVCSEPLTICGVAPQRFTALRGSAFAVWRGLRLR